jgi:hypothetical protein
VTPQEKLQQYGCKAEKRCVLSGLRPYSIPLCAACYSAACQDPVTLTLMRAHASRAQSSVCSRLGRYYVCLVQGAPSVLQLRPRALTPVPALPAVPEQQPALLPERFSHPESADMTAQQQEKGRNGHAKCEGRRQQRV